MKLVYENEHGAYLRMSAQFLEEFGLKESNPNFEVFDSQDNHRRFITVKSSRLPDDEDLAEGRYGMDFHRAKPTLKEALDYKQELPHALESRKWLGNIAFATTTEEEYKRKSSIWENFYSYIFGSPPKTIWVAPHSGNVTRVPDDILPYPKLEIDAFTAGVAASCAFNDKSKASGRIMISIHGNGYLGAILDLGGFGILEQEKLNSVTEKMEMKYHEKVQILASEYKQDFFTRAMRRLEHIEDKRGILNPEELRHISTADKYDVGNIVKGLKLYGQEITEFTVEEFEQAMHNLDEMEVQAVSSNHLFSGRHVGNLLRLPEKVKQGLLHSALQVECSKLYLERQPELITSMISDIKNEIFADG
jgi:hypothetical protein